MMSSMLGPLSGRQRLFLFTGLLLTAAVSLAFWTGGWLLTIFTSFLLALLLVVSQGVWLPTGYGATLVRRASLGVALVVATTFSWWNVLLSSVVVQPLLDYLQVRYPRLPDIRVPDAAPAIDVLVFVLVAIFIVNYFTRDKTTMGIHSGKPTEDFPEKSYAERLIGFCDLLKDDITAIDRKSLWTAKHYTPLKAQVEIFRGSASRRSIVDMLAAIKQDKDTRAFLVIGDPGSGKSVALRQLARELLQEVTSTGRVPIYLNLREWYTSRSWTETAPPTTTELYAFAEENLRVRLDDMFAEQFIDDYLRLMFEHGRIFWILDSFDEIPTVLDEQENSPLIDDLSSVAYHFVAGAHESRGVLSSRPFRRPTMAFPATTTLEVRPFTDLQVAENLRRQLPGSDPLIKKLFAERDELVPIARSPFTASLIVEYAREHPNELPRTQAELYPSYIRQRLARAKRRLAQRDVTIDGVLECTKKIASKMFKNRDYGLEAPVSWLEEALPEEPISATVDVLAYTRLARLGSGDVQRFSLAHRRFSEYFVGLDLSEHPGDIPSDSIPTDSRWRDALVFYCEIAEEAKAKSLATFCWTHVARLSGSEGGIAQTQFLKSLHCLRFLTDAFRARQPLLSEFRTPLGSLVIEQLENAKHPFHAKQLLEAVGLLHARHQVKVALIALDSGNSWLSETAFKACRFLPRVSPELERSVARYLDSLSPLEYLARRRDLLFSLSLSSSWDRVSRYCSSRFFDLGGLFFSTAVASIFAPAWVVSALALAFAAILLRGLPRAQESLSLAISVFRLVLVVALGKYLVIVNPMIERWALLDRHILALLGMLVIALSVFLAVPRCQLKFMVIEPWQRLPKDERWSICKKYLTRIPIYAIGMLMAFGVFKTYAWLKDIWPWCELVALAVMALYFMLMGTAIIWHAVPRFLRAIGKTAIWSRDLVIDWSLFRRRQGHRILTRTQIASNLESLRTRRMRVRLLSSIEESGLRPTGEWPGGALPYFGDDNVDNYLGRLEERWLGLSR